MQKLFWSVSLLLLNLGLTGFDFTTHSIPPQEIVGGGPPKDGIPAILAPRFLPAAKADFLADQDQVIGVIEGLVAKAYPLRILNWHEVVNDRDAQSGELLPAVVAYWFAWAAFHPQAEVYRLPAQSAPQPKVGAVREPPLPQYFPLAPGNTWLFEQRALLNGTVEATEEWAVTEQNDEGFILTATYRPSEVSGTVGEAKEVVTREQLSFQKDGLWKVFQGSVASEGAVFVLKLPLQVGTSWQEKRGTYTITATGRQAELSSGTFTDCVEVTFRDHDGVFTVTSLYAPGVGMVRQETRGKPLWEMGGDAGGGTENEFRQLMVLKSWQVRRNDED